MAATRPVLHLVVPGPLDQRTGGYLYDAHVVRGLRTLGWSVRVHELAGAFPAGDDEARASLEAALAGITDDARVVLDGLALGGLPGPVREHARRLRILALVHHPLADETGLDAAERDRLRKLEGEALAAVWGVVVTSPFTAGRLEAWGVPPGRVRVVPPGTDPAPLATGSAAGEPPALLCVGTVSPRKGQDVLVRALARIRDLPWTCVCPGSLDRDAPFARTVLEQVGASGLTDRILFPGELDAGDLGERYDGSDLFVLPSWYEGYGMALAEALARGLPVVGTTGGAIPWTVPADAGVLLPPGDDRALADALVSLLDGPGGRRRRAELARAARRHADDLPRWEDAARAFAAAVEELTAERPEPRGPR